MPQHGWRVLESGCGTRSFGRACAGAELADPAGAGASDEESYPAFRRTADELDDRIGLLVLQMTDTKGPKARAE